MADIYEQGQAYIAKLFDSPIDPTSKLTNLTQTNTDKLNLLNSKAITIAGFEDADTVKTTDSTYRLQPARGGMYDAVESKHGNTPIDMYGTSGSKSPTAMTAQRQLVSKMVGKPENQLTEQDFIDVSNYQTVQMAADTINGPGVWQAPFGKGTDPVNLTGRYKDANGNVVNEPLNIQATVQDKGADKFNRKLGVLGTESGVDVTTPAAIDPNRNARYSTLDVNANVPSTDSTLTDEQIASAAIAKATGRSGLGNAARGAAYRGIEGIAQTADLVPEAIEFGYKKLTGNDKAKWSDVEGLYSEQTGEKLKRALGYNDKPMQELAEKAKTAVTNAYEKGDYWGVVKTLADAVLTSEVGGESLGFMAGMILPGTGALKALRMESGVAKEAKALATAENISTAEALKRVEDNADFGYKATKMVLSDAGQINYAEQVARDSEKEYKEKYGVEMDADRRAGAFMLGFISGKLDSGMGLALLKGTDPLAMAVKSAWQTSGKELQDSVVGSIAKATGWSAARVAGAMAEEGVTEGIQTGLENTAARYNPNVKGGTISELLTDRENLLEMGRDALIGAAGGAQFSAPSVVKDATVGTVRTTGDIIQTLNDTANIKETNTQREVIKAADTEVNEKVTNIVNNLSPEKLATLRANMMRVLAGEEIDKTTPQKNIAAEILTGSDSAKTTAGKLGIDPESLDYAELIKSAAFDNVPLDVKDVMNKIPTISEEEVQDAINNGLSLRKAVDSLTSGVDSGGNVKGPKTAEEVNHDVVNGSRGFLTYMKAAEVAENEDDRAAAIDKLQNLYAIQADKVNRIASYEQAVINSVKKMIAATKPEGAEVTDADIKKFFIQRYGNKTNSERAKIAQSIIGKDLSKGWTFKIATPHVIETYLTGDKGIGGYRAIDRIREEADAMKTILNTLYAPVQEQVVANEEVGSTLDVNADSTEQVIPEQVVDTVPEQVVGTTEVTEPVRKTEQTVIQDEIVPEDEVVGIEDFDMEEFMPDEFDDVVPEEFDDVMPDEFDDQIVPFDMDEIYDMSMEDMDDGQVQSTKELRNVLNEIQNVSTELEQTSNTDAEYKSIEARLNELKVQLSGMRNGVNKWFDSIKDRKITTMQGAKTIEELYNVVPTGYNVFNAVEQINIVDFETGADTSNKDERTAKDKLKRELEKAGSKTTNEYRYVGLVSGEDKVVDNRVAAAMDSAVSAYIAENAYDMMESISNADAYKMFPGVDWNAMGATEAIEEFQEKGGKLAQFVAKDLGKAIMENIGLKPKNVVDVATYEAIQASLGAVAMELAEERGVWNIKNIQIAAGVSITVVEMNVDTMGMPGGNNAVNTAIQEARLANDVYEAKYGIEVNGKKGPLANKPETRTRVNIHRQPYAQATKEQTDAVNKLESMSYRISNGGMKVLEQIFGTSDREGLKNSLMEYLGYREISDADKEVSKTTRIAQAGINMASKNAVDTLLDAADQFKDKPMWFKWFLTKGGRFQMESVGLNPQQQKQLHRFLVVADSARTELDAAEVNAMIESDEMPTGKMLALNYAIAQAFNADVDKISPEQVVVTAKEIMRRDVDELVTDVRNNIKRYKHLGQTAVAIDLLQQLRDGNEKINSELTVEFDGLTNGFSFKVMQYPLEDYKTWLPKIGVLTGDELKYDSVGAMKSSTKQLDTYETIGSKFNTINWGSIEYAVDQVNDMLDTIFEGRQYYPIASIDMDSTVTKIMTGTAIKSVLPTIENVNGKVSSEVRKLMKDPTMIFNYGAGIVKIAENIANNLMLENIDKLLEARGSMILKELGVVNVVEAQDSLREYPITSKYNTEVRERLLEVYKYSYGVPVAYALSETFGTYIKLNQAINGTFGAMYDVFKDMLGDISMLSETDITKKVRDMVKKGLVAGVDIAGASQVAQKLFVMSRTIEKLGNTNIPRTNSKGVAYKFGLVKNSIGSPEAAGGVLMTHVKDGISMARTVLDTKGGFNEIHDAKVIGLEQTDSTKDYNKNWYELNKSYSDMNELIKAAEQMLLSKDPLTNNVTKAHKKALSEQIAELKGYNKVIQANRAELFGAKAKIGQMVGMPGSMYEVNGTDVARDGLPLDVKASDTVTNTSEQAIGENADTVVENDAVVTGINVPPVTSNVVKQTALGATLAKVNGNIATIIVENRKDC